MNPVEMVKVLRLSRTVTEGCSVPLQVRFRVASLAVFLIMSGSVFGPAQQPPNAPALERTVSPEWARIREGLMRAKPMPDPPHALRPEVLTPSGDLVRFDPLTGNISQSAASKDSSANTSVPREEGHPSVLPKSATTDEPINLPTKSNPGTSGITSTLAVKPAITPTPPSPFYYPYSFPFNTEFRMLMRFPVTGFPDQYYLCSASSVSDFHILSAAHCVYNHDPLGDSSGRGAGFAAEIWAWPAETDVVDPIDHTNWPDFPYGVSKMTYEVTYNAWISNSDLNWDFSFIALDRRIGDHVGWMGTEWGVNTSALNFDGYPAEAPYVPSNNPYQYPGFDAGNVIGYTCCRIQLDALTYGGHSGGGVWRYDGTNSYIEGVNSTSNRVGYAEATLFTSQTHTDLTNTITTDQSARPPQDLSQLIEYVFNTTSKGLVDTSVLVGNSFRLTLNAFNAGYTSAGATTADIYLTTSELFSSGTYIGTVNLGSLDAYQYTVQTQYVTVPSYVAPGNYYVGWVIGGANAQYGTDRNFAIITNQTLQVVSLASLGVAPGGIVGGHTSIGTVTLTSPAPTGGATITLSSTNGAASVPGSVFVGSGASSANFTITTSPVLASTVATIQASWAGINRTATLSIQPAGLAALTLAPTTVVGGDNVAGSVVLTGPAPAGGITIALTSSNALAPVPANVHINAGLSSAPFTITTSRVAVNASALIKAAYLGVTKQLGLNLQPVEPISITLAPSAVFGGFNTIGKITLNGPAPSGGVNIAVTSSISAAKVPLTVHLNQGVSSATFTITTSQVAAKVSALIAVADNGVSKSAVLAILPIVPVSLSLSPSTVLGGQGAIGKVTINTAAPNGGVNVALASSSVDAKVPPSLHVNPGATSATFAITTSKVTARVIVSIKATDNGVSKTAALTINP